MWYVYILRARDASLYTGITVDIQRRIMQHNTSSVLGSKSLRAKRPVILVYAEHAKNRSDASKRESAIKRLSRAQKEILIQTGCANGMLS